MSTSAGSKAGMGKGQRLIRLGLVIAAVGMGPLLLYILFGPADGNPIGLGLLAFFSMPVALVLLVVGFAKRLHERARDG